MSLSTEMAYRFMGVLVTGALGLCGVAACVASPTQEIQYDESQGVPVSEIVQEDTLKVMSLACDTDHFDLVGRTAKNAAPMKILISKPSINGEEPYDSTYSTEVAPGGEFSLPSPVLKKGEVHRFDVSSNPAGTQRSITFARIFIDASDCLLTLDG